MDFTNYEKDLYNEIQRDEKLKNFFVNLTNRANKIISFESEKINKAYNVIKPSFNELTKVIEVLEREGVLKPKEGYDLYTCTKEELYGHVPYFIIFNTLNFYDISFFVTDIEHMQNYNGAEKYIQEMESDYEECLADIKKNYKKIEQCQKKLAKLKNKGKTEEKETEQLQNEISKLQKFIKMDETKKAKIDFFRERSVEKASYVLKVHDMIKELSEEYDKYLNNKKNADLEINKIRKAIYDKVFEDIEKTSMVEFDTAEIEKKLFKLVILNKLQKSPFVFKNDNFELNVTKDEEPKYDFDTAAVDWFIRVKKENFKELFNYVFDNFETSMEEITEKVLKK